MSLALFHDTIVAQSTPNGTGALAIVRVSGSDAIQIVSALLASPEALWVARGGTSVYSDIVIYGERLDDVVLHVFRAPRSYTGEDLIEITCHGNPGIVRPLIDQLVATGCRLAEPGEFSRRAFFHGKISLEEAELVAFKAEQTNSLALRGFEKKLREKFERLGSVYRDLIALLAQVNAQIDFGESDDIVVEGLEGAIERAIQEIGELAARSGNERLNTGSFAVALVGPPNVGKSSLFNRILRFERSIVSEQPGTTRDYVEAFIDLEGIPVKIIDTAGVRIVSEFTESRGIELGKQASLYADLILRATSPEDRNPTIEEGQILLHNKIEVDHYKSSELAVSAITGEGMDNLHNFILERASAHAAEFSSSAVSDAERAILVEAVSELERIPASEDLTVLAEELRSVVERIGQLLGFNISEDTLNHIFSSMCIGK